MRTAACIVAATALCLQGCASTPRAFEPRIAPPPADVAVYEAAFAQCSADVASGRRSSFRDGRATSGFGGAAIGGVAGVAAAGSAASGGGMLAGVAAGAGLMAGLIIVTPLAIYGLSRSERARKEREIQEAMTACLAEEGYVVTGWVRATEGGTGLRSPTTATPAIPD